jgi:hypothetical protein
MVAIVKWSVVVLLLSTIVVASEENLSKLKKSQVWVCVRWQWSGAPFEGRVTCVEWAKKDCSNRLYPEICKRGG